MALNVISEAKRCLNCKKPMCREGCPISTNIPKMIEMFKNSQIEEAGEMLFDNNPLSTVCSLVCNHENQCQGHCVLGRKGDPVHISSIENYISTTYLERLKFNPAPKNGKMVGIVGSGPAGITIAITLARRGYDVSIFEAKDKIGGVLRYGIPEFRLPKSILEKYKELMLELGIKIRPNATIGGAISIDDIFRDGYDALFIGTGVWQPNSLKIKGESLGNVHYAIAYLINPDEYNLGDNLIIIGAGNAAMDVARTAIRKGVRNVTVFNRSDQVAASETEFEYAKIDGVNFEYCKMPVEIKPDGVIFRDTKVEEDGSINAIEGSDKLYPSSSVIISISQGAQDVILSKTKGIDTTKKGLLVTNEYGETTREGIFASGDVVKGAKTVVEAVKYSKLVADAMDEYMQGLDKDK
ncbi:MAG: NAD(P)-dependent oxidoreductase [Clostridiales bacterium]|nr:NAD(P)-dependent oxidoreductase [Clostridiales bacterium]